MVLTSTAVLQKPWSQNRLVEPAYRVPAEHDDQKLHEDEAQHCAREPDDERVAG